MAKSWNENLVKLKTHPISNLIFLKNSQPFKFGEIHKNENLANTLNSIANKGSEEFYKGYIARDIVNSLNSIGGLHSLEDFNDQDTIFSDSLEYNYKNLNLH